MGRRRMPGVQGDAQSLVRPAPNLSTRRGRLLRPAIEKPIDSPRACSEAEDPATGRMGIFDWSIASARRGCRQYQWTRLRGAESPPPDEGLP